MQIIPEQRVPVVDSIKLTSISMLDRAKLACNTMRVLEEIKGNTGEPTPTEEEKSTARDAFKALTENNGLKAPSMSVLASYPSASLVYLDKMLSEYDHEIINSAVRIREYTKNKLLIESENPDGKIRIRALELLGKMKDVGLFTDRIEITNKTKTDEELEAELNKKLERYMGSALVVQDVDPLKEEEDSEAEEEPPKSDPLGDAHALIDDITP